jgi:ABC-type antimicrobial peptide transport system permease subunit
MNERLVASLSAMFGGLATLLAVIGLYGVMAYTVAQRTHEIGIRVALGAQRGNVVWLMMREVMVMVAIGFCIGLPAAWFASKLVSSLLYGVRQTIPCPLPRRSPFWAVSRFWPDTFRRSELPAWIR